jgi:hypothetical protein
VFTVKSPLYDRSKQPEKVEFQVATTCFSCDLPEVNLVAIYTCKLTTVTGENPIAVNNNNNNYYYYYYLLG